MLPRGLLLLLTFGFALQCRSCWTKRTVRMISRCFISCLGITLKLSPASGRSGRQSGLSTSGPFLSSGLKSETHHAWCSVSAHQQHVFPSR